VAAVTGGCFAIWVCYVSPRFKFERTDHADVLLMVIVEEWGRSMENFGAAFLMVTAPSFQSYRYDCHPLLPGVPFAVRLSERWLFYFGLLFIIIGLFLSKGDRWNSPRNFFKKKS